MDLTQLARALETHDRVQVIGPSGSGLTRLTEQIHEHWPHAGVVGFGIVLGLIGGMVAAPVAAFVYGGTAGVGTGALVSLFREMGGSLIASVTTQAFISDPVDKVIVMVVAYLTVKALPQRTVRAFAPRTADAA